jgi:hypothetical protein
MTSHAPKDLSLALRLKTNRAPMDWSLAPPVTTGLKLFPVVPVVRIAAAEAIAIDDRSDWRRVRCALLWRWLGLLLLNRARLPRQTAIRLTAQTA